MWSNQSDYLSLIIISPAAFAAGDFYFSPASIISLAETNCLPLAERRLLLISRRWRWSRRFISEAGRVCKVKICVICAICEPHIFPRVLTISRRFRKFRRFISEARRVCKVKICVICAICELHIFPRVLTISRRFRKFRRFISEAGRVCKVKICVICGICEKYKPNSSIRESCTGFFPRIVWK